MSQTVRAAHSALHYVKRFSGKTVVVKLGGAALQNTDLVKSICSDLSLIRASGSTLVLVHGGGPSINEELEAHGITWEFVEGSRVTTPQMMEVVEMVLCGRVNQRIVRALNHAGLSAGVKAVGLSGNDAGMLVCSQANTRLGQVGQIEEVDPTLIQSILNQRSEMGVPYIPVISPVGMGHSGEAFNINADWVASRIAQALSARKLVFLTDQDGIMDLKNSRLIPELDAGALEKLINDGTVTGGMLTKARTILHALKNGVPDVHVINAQRPHALIEELFTDNGIGTVCRARAVPPAPTGFLGDVTHV